MIVAEVLCVVFGVVIVFLVLSAAVRTVVVPRAEQVFLNRLVFRMTRVCFEAFAKESRSYKDRDRVMARYAPTSLMLLPFVWMAGVIGGFSAIFWGLGARPYEHALILAGSSATTLGFERSDGFVVHLLVIAEAFRRLPVGEFRIQVNNRKIPQGFYLGIGLTDVAATLRTVDKLAKIGPATVSGAPMCASMRSV